MAISRVKRKFPAMMLLALLAVVTAVLSGTSFLPVNSVESVYARFLFPTISHTASFFADAVPFSWLDLWIVCAAVLLVVSVRRRNWRLPLGMVCTAYLVFFWGWGLNYHRLPLEKRLGFESAPKAGREEFNQLTMATAASLNQLWPTVSKESPETVASMAAARVQYVLHQIDGTDWTAASRIKHSYLADWWFRIAGIDGVFNPFGHEPILTGGAPGFELPFLMAHELAHVHGIADEGDANFIAFLATAESRDRTFQYSAAFEMWLHLRGPVQLLDEGPRGDLQAYYARLRAQEIPQATRLQSKILDSHLRANGVHDGVASYSRFVMLAIATQKRWHEFQ